MNQGRIKASHCILIHHKAQLRCCAANARPFLPIKATQGRIALEYWAQLAHSTSKHIANYGNRIISIKGKFAKTGIGGPRCNQLHASVVTTWILNMTQQWHKGDLHMTHQPRYIASHCLLIYPLSQLMCFCIRNACSINTRCSVRIVADWHQDLNVSTFCASTTEHQFASTQNSQLTAVILLILCYFASALSVLI